MFPIADHRDFSEYFILLLYSPSLLDGAVLTGGVGLGTDLGEEPRGGMESDEPLW